MNNKIYVGNLPYNMDENSFRIIFSQFGKIKQVKIVKDTDTNQSRGFGFITFSSHEEAKESLIMGGQLLDERKLFVSFARERTKSEEAISS